MSLLKGCKSKADFTRIFYRIYKEAFKYDPKTLEVFNDLEKYPHNKRSD